MNKKSTIIVISIIGVLLVGAAAYWMFGRPTAAPSKSQAAIPAQVNTASTEYQGYNALKGEAYDRSFLANMIIHHQGAVEMANVALTNTSRVEIKTMAKDIISAQQKEIADMTAWQKSWGYLSSGSEPPMDPNMNMGGSSSTGSMNNMDSAAMTADLKSKTETAFDKAFIAAMIKHHQAAIDMAAPGKTNAQHQELKDLTVAIVTAQTKEIEQLKKWQSDWAL